MSSNGQPTNNSDPNPQIRGSEMILLVDDELPLRALVRQMLQKHGYRVLEAESGRAALALWPQHGDEIDLLLTDVVMPDGINGRELAEKLQALKPGLKVIYSSGYGVDIVGKGFLKEGENFLQKPYPPAKLVQLMRAILDGAAGAK
jgi:two-component system cell cycle sensor histidine kinase/response regulator CckA